MDAAAATLARIRAAEAAFQQREDAKKPKPLWQRFAPAAPAGVVVAPSAVVSSVHPESPSGAHTPLMVDPAQQALRGGFGVTDSDRVPDIRVRMTGHKTDGH